MITEPPRPPLPPDQRPERLLTVDTRCFPGIYVHDGYKWLHNVALRRCEPEAEVLICRNYSLVLLQAPMKVVCTSTGWSFRMMAGILSTSADGTVNGWMVSNHTEARDTFDLLTNPERILAEPAEDDGPDYEDHDEEDDEL